jgi:hypothetical protein
MPAPTAAPTAPITALPAPMAAIVPPLEVSASLAPAADEPTLPTAGRLAESSPSPAQAEAGRPDPSQPDHSQPDHSQPDLAIAEQPGAPAAPAERPIERNSTCTTAQLRRFIKSRAYLPIHEIRRRFLIAVEDDDVTGVQLGPRRIYVGRRPARPSCWATSSVPARSATSSSSTRSPRSWSGSTRCVRSPVPERRSGLSDRRNVAWTTVPRSHMPLDLRHRFDAR